jgi:FkbM family methyltransferase
MKLAAHINRPLKKLGIQLKRYPDNDLKRRIKLINQNKINKIFDIGANTGIYARSLRSAGYKGKIVSFEPLSKAFKILKKKSQRDAGWQAINIALGSRDEERLINIAGNSESSSLLDMLPEHVRSAPKSSYIGQEKITVSKLDTILKDYCHQGDCILLKIDTQGFEREVLAGAIQSLPRITGIQIEMSLIMLYEGEMLYLEMISFLKEKGFNLFSLENGFSNPATGQLLQIDGLFFR